MKSKFYDTLKSLSLLEGISALLDWDQQVYMPKAGGNNRSEQLEMIAVLKHEKLTHPSLREAAEAVLHHSESSEEDTVNAKGVIRIIDRETKLPSNFVAEKSRASSEAFQLWTEAKPSKNFKQVQPALERIIKLSKEEASLVGYTEHPYDALLDQYEWGGKVSWVHPMLSTLSDRLIPLVQKLSEKTKDWNQNFPLEIPKQKDLNQTIMKAMGMADESSRLDASAHPFCTTIGPDDYRITTRFDESNFLSALLSTLHETGHSLYEAGLPMQWRGTPCGTAVSLGIHESQSRLYENMIGRSVEFSSYLARTTGVQKSKDIWKTLNQVHPSLIRVEADEVSYSLHVLLRLELELLLITDKLSVADLPEAWNASYKKYLGVTPSHDGEGVLQDVHWYSGAIGYFATYVLGNIYSGMMLEKLVQDHPDLFSQIESGNFKNLLQWLIQHVHQKGQRKEPRALVEEVAGKKITAEPFIAYLERKFENELR